MAAIHFFTEGVPSFKFPNPRKTSSWIELVVKKEKFRLREVNYIFTTDAYLLEINKQYLKHNTFTDIITFDFSEGKDLEAEIYVSVERVRENAIRFHTDFQHELRRVVIHGVLHIMGYRDKKPQEKARMREKEEACLSLFKK